MLSSFKSLWNEKTVALSRKGKTAEIRSGFKLSRMLFITNAKRKDCWEAPSGFPLRVTRSRVKEQVPFRGQVLVNAVYERGAWPRSADWFPGDRPCHESAARQVTGFNDYSRSRRFSVAMCLKIENAWRNCEILPRELDFPDRYVENRNLRESIRISMLYETLWNFMRYLDRYLV